MDDDVVYVTRLERVEPDIDGVALALWGRLDPDIAWHYAVSGDTAARMAGTHCAEEYARTAELLRRAATYGWWPKRTPGGDYIAVPLKQWVAEGHPFTPKVPNVEMMLDRWGIQPVVVDAAADDGPLSFA